MGSNSVGETFAIYTVFSVAFILFLIAMLIAMTGAFVLLSRSLRAPKLEYSGPWATPRTWLFKRARRWALWAIVFLALSVGGLAGMKSFEDEAENDAREMRRQIDESRILTPGKLLDRLWEALTQ